MHKVYAGSAFAQGGNIAGADTLAEMIQLIIYFIKL